MCVCLFVLSSLFTELGSRPFRLILGCHSDSGMDCVPGRKVDLPDMLCLFKSWPTSWLCQAQPTSDQTAYMDACKKCHKTACASLPEDEHLDARNMSNTL